MWFVANMPVMILVCVVLVLICVRVCQRLWSTATAEKTLKKQAEKLHAANRDLQDHKELLEAQRQELVATNSELVEKKALLEAQRQELLAKNIELESAQKKVESANSELMSTNRQLEGAIQRANDMAMQAEQANVFKSAFLANMSHEIRTPITAILGFAEEIKQEIISSGACNDGRHRDTCSTCLEYAGIVHRNSKHLLCLINDVLDLSKIEAGKLDIEIVTYSPSEVVREAVQLMQESANQKRLALDMESVGTLPDTIGTDPTRFRQILINLLGNAIKFTESGNIRVVVDLVEEGPDKHMIQCDVIDTGVGMTEERVTAVFEPFLQADSSTTRVFGGTGLGLCVSRQLARLLGGDVNIVETQPGCGTHMRITIVDMGVSKDHARDKSSGDRSDTDSPSEESDVVPDKLDCRILLAEDGPDNQRLLSVILTKAGADLTVVANGREAVDEALRAQEQRTPFEVILMDMQMPVMDGYEATRLLRKREYGGVIIALTAHAMASDRDQCLAMGCDDYETKPINRKRLIAIISKHLCQCAAQPA